MAKYAKTPQQMKLLWSSILLNVNNRLDIITTTLVGKVWKDICHDKRYSHICKYEEDIMNKIDIFLKERSKQLRKKQMNNVCNDTNTNTITYTTSTSYIYPQTLYNDVNSFTPSNSNVNNYNITPSNNTNVNNYNITPSNTNVNNYNIAPSNTNVNNYSITPINSPQFSNQTNSNQMNYPKVINNNIYNGIIPIVPVTTIPLSPVSQCSIVSSEEDEVIGSIFNLSNENSHSTQSSHIYL